MGVVRLRTKLCFVYACLTHVQARLVYLAAMDGGHAGIAGAFSGLSPDGLRINGITMSYYDPFQTETVLNSVQFQTRTLSCRDLR